MNHPNFHSLIKSHWNNNLFDINNNISNIKREIKFWSLKNFKNIFYEKRKIYARLLGLQKALCSNPVPQHLILEKKLQKDHYKILKQEEQFWQMKSRINWITFGDKNTNFFHQNTTIRTKRNNILCLTKDDGSLTWDSNDISNSIFLYLKKIYSNTNHINNHPFNIPNLPKLNSNIVSSLIIPPSPLEINTTCFNLCPFKAPGEDGLHAFLYKKKTGILSKIKSFTSLITSSLIGLYSFLEVGPSSVLFLRSIILLNPQILDLLVFVQPIIKSLVSFFRIVLNLSSPLLFLLSKALSKKESKQMTSLLQLMRSCIPCTFLKVKWAR